MNRNSKQKSWIRAQTPILQWLCTLLNTMKIPTKFPLRRLLLVVAGLFSSLHSVAASDSLKNQLFFSGAIGQHYGSSAIDFFADYRSLLGGELEEFSSSSALNFATTMPLNDNFRLGLQIQSYFLEGKETYNQPVVSTLRKDTIGTRSLYQDFGARIIPVFITAEYYAVRAQFQTYVTASIGVGVTDIYWNEGVTSTVPDDVRRGGLHLDETLFHPALKIGVGSELGFDAFVTGSSLHSLFFEVTYSWIGTQLTPFTNIERQLNEEEKEKLDNTSANYSVNTGGLSVFLGLRIFIARQG